MKQSLSENDAKTIKIDIGADGTPHEFDISAFFYEDKGGDHGGDDPKKSSKWWIWALLAVAAIAIVLACIGFFMKRKERGPEEGVYYDKNEPFVEPKDDKIKINVKRDSDEFN